jgi:hypothetical protein
MLRNAATESRLYGALEGLLARNCDQCGERGQDAIQHRLLQYDLLPENFENPFYCLFINLDSIGLLLH